MAEEVKVKQGKSTKVKETLRVIKYALCAGSAGIIETLSFTLLNETMNWPYWPAYLIALVLSVLWNFTLNRKFTYRSANNVPKAMLQTSSPPSPPLAATSLRNTSASTTMSSSSAPWR